MLLVRIWLTFSGAKDPEAALLLAEDGRNDLEQVRPAGWQQQRRRADAKNLALVHRREARIGADRGESPPRTGSSAGRAQDNCPGLRLRPLSSQTTSKGADLNHGKSQLLHIWLGEQGRIFWSTNPCQNHPDMLLMGRTSYLLFESGRNVRKHFTPYYVLLCNYDWNFKNSFVNPDCWHLQPSHYWFIISKMCIFIGCLCCLVF